MSTSEDILVRVENVRKKFCRDLKRSLFYGLQDILSDLNPFAQNGVSGSSFHADPLRKDEFWAVNDISFHLRRGESLGLIGHNGAGKTTVLKMLNGLIRPDQGRIEMRGRVGALIALGAGFNPILTGRENIYVNGAVLGMTKREIDAKIEDIIDFAEIREFIDAPVQSYSSGMGVRLGFAIAAKCQPDILLLDEVLAVGDMGFQAKCFNRLGEMRRQGIATVLVSHNMHHITRFCDNVLYLKHGQIAYFGDTEQGVDMFHRDMLTGGSASTVVNSHRREEAGSLAVVIEEAYFTNAQGGRVSEIACGDLVRLVMNYHCAKGPVFDPVIELILRDSSGEAWFQGSNRMSGVTVGEIRERGQLAVTFPNLPANNQVLSLSIVVWDSPMHELIYWSRGLKLRVNGNPNSTGRVMINCQWASELSEAKIFVPLVPR